MPLPDSSSVERIGVLGAGLIGASWAAHFLAQGKDVFASDPAADTETKLRDYVAQAWPALEQLGLAPGASPDRLNFNSDPTRVLGDAQFIQESAPERLAIKSELLSSIEAHISKDTVISSSSSGLLVSDLQERLSHPERLVLGHPFNPPHLIPLVEVVGGKQTAPAVIDWTVAFYNAHGKRAVRLNKEIPGHIANRLQAAMWREAIHLVAEGVADVGDVDAAVASGPGLRWALMGPHMTFHLGGGDGGMTSFMEHLAPGVEVFWQDLGSPKLTPELQRQIIEGVEKESQGLTTKELSTARDRKLLRLLSTLQQLENPDSH